MALNVDRDFLCGHLNLPRQYKSSNFSSYIIEYDLEVKSGFLGDKVKCLFQIKFNQYNQWFTGKIENWGQFTKPSVLTVRTSCFDDFHLYFNKNIPLAVKNRYPHLQKMLGSMSYNPNEYHIIEEYGFRFTHEYNNNDIKIFETDQKKPLDSDKLSFYHANEIYDCMLFVARAFEEYSEYKKTRLYKMMQPKVSTLKEKIENGASLYMIYRFAKLGYSLYSGMNLGDDGSPDVAIDTITNDITDSEMADFLCDTDVTQDFESSDITFTGSGDKYSDNKYNREAADEWFKKEKDCLAKGDASGAAAAHSTAMSHVKRIET